MQSEISEIKTVANPPRPWWREPIAIGLFAFTLLASTAVLSQGWFRPHVPVDPTKPTPVPGGGSFCDPAAPVQSTAINPSTHMDDRGPQR